MATSTPLGLPIIEPGIDRIKDGAEPSALAEDINSLARAADMNISQAEERVKIAAANDAATKYGSLPSRVTNAESKNTTQDSRLDGVESTNAGQAGWLSNLETAKNQQAGRLDTVEGTTIPAAIGTAKTAAINDATTKYGALPGKVTTLEARTTTQNLGTDDLDAKTAPGIYGQNTTGNATTARHYPEQSRGNMVVEAVSGTATVTQRYTASFTQNVYLRELYNGAWSPWKPQTPGKTTALTTEDLDAVKGIGTYVQNSGSSATPERHYPTVARGFLNVVPISGISTVAQVFHATSAGEIYMREFYASTWGAWTKIAGGGGGTDTSYEPRLSNAETDISVLDAEQDVQDGRLSTLEAQSGLANPVKNAQVDGDGLLTFTLADDAVTGGVPIPASLPTDQADYVELMRRRSPTTSLELRKADSTGRIEVSCVAPSGLHTTYEFKGAGNGTTDDDYRMQQRIWIGDSTGSTRNKKTLLGPSSNRDFAIQIAPTGSGLPPAFMPDHGPATAWNVEAPRFYHGGALIDVDAMTSGQVLGLSGSFEVVQHVMGRHPDAPTTDLVEMWTTHTIHPDGAMSTDGRLRVVTPTTIGPGYFIMCPVDGGLFTDVVSSLNNSYPHNAGLVGTNTFLPESDVATSYVMLSATRRDVGVAFRYNNPAETIRRGQADKLPASQRTWLEHRADGTILKLYQRPWASPLDLPAGYVHRFSGDFIYMQAPNLFDQMAR